MDGRSLVWLLALAFAGTSSLAGCIEAPEWMNTTGAEVSAQANKDLADDAAAAWNPDAELVAVMTFELTDAPAEMDVPADPDVGNGLAMVWWYTYCVEATDTEPMQVKVYRVTADGQVAVEDDAEMLAGAYSEDMPEMETLGAWTVDSDAAVATAKTNDTFRAAAEGYNATLVSGIAHHDGATAWWTVAMSADGFALATVDAATGELLEVRAFDMDFDFDMPEWGYTQPPMWAGEPILLEGEGTATPTSEPYETAFTVTGPVHGLMVLTYGASFPTDGLHWAILDEDGEWIAGDHVTNWRGDGGEAETEVEIEEAGEYVLQVTYMAGVPGSELLPTGGSVDYAFVLELSPGFMPDHDEDEG